MITEDNPTTRDPADSTLVYYGPHECGRCGRLIVKAAFEQGGAEFDYPRHDPIYPNTRWTPHACDPADIAARPQPGGAPTSWRTHTLSGLDITDLAAVRRALANAQAVGHWRRILAIYGDHLPACALRGDHAEGTPVGCDCGWSTAFEP